MADDVSEDLNDEQRERLRAALHRVQFAKLLGIELIAARRGSVTLGLQIRDDLRQIHGVLHGGATAALIDTATAFAILSQLSDAQKFTTVDLTVNYLRPLHEGKITARAKVIRAGRRLLTVSAEVFDESGKIAAMALSTYIPLT